MTASEPIVPFKETISEPPKTDMVNEDIDIQSVTTVQQEINEKNERQKIITLQTPNKQCIIKIRAVPLPKGVTDLLDKNADILKILESFKPSKVSQDELEKNVQKLNVADESVPISINDKTLVIETLNDRSLKAIEVFKNDLKAAFDAAGSVWNNAVEEIWSAGPRKCGPNLLLNRTKDYKKSLFDFSIKEDAEKDLRDDFTNSFLNGFQLATLAGPLCEEPMMGVAFAVEEWSITKEDEDSVAASHPYGPFSG